MKFRAVTEQAVGIQSSALASAEGPLHRERERERERASERERERERESSE